jgi:hypothetical protein
MQKNKTKFFLTRIQKINNSMIQANTWRKCLQNIYHITQIPYIQNI